MRGLRQEKVAYKYLCKFVFIGYPGRDSDGGVPSRSDLGRDAMPTARTRALGFVGLICLLVTFGFAFRSADKCRQTGDCGGYKRVADKTPQREDGGTFWQKVLDDPIAYFTFWLATFTGGLTLASIWQGYFLIRADKAAKASANAALAAANSISLQSGILDKQAEISRQALYAAHKPRLRVRNIVVTGNFFQINEPISGQFYVANSGGTDAKITESHCVFLWNVNGLPMARPYERHVANNPITPGTVIAGNLGHTALFNTIDDPLYRVWPFEAKPGAGVGLQPRAFILGWIEYEDGIGLKRRMAFCREFLQKDGSARFYPVEDPDYEYEE
jgi:hypothetical protein